MEKKWVVSILAVAMVLAVLFVANLEKVVGVGIAAAMLGVFLMAPGLFHIYNWKETDRKGALTRFSVLGGLSLTLFGAGLIMLVELVRWQIWFLRMFAMTTLAIVLIVGLFAAVVFLAFKFRSAADNRIRKVP